MPYSTRIAPPSILLAPTYTKAFPSGLQESVFIALWHEAIILDGSMIFINCLRQYNEICVITKPAYMV